MKKYLILTSILALAACGGGSGGGHGTPVDTPLDLTLPDGVRSAVSDEVQESNSHVTSIKSEVLVASSGGRTQVVRSSTPVTNASGVTFISYDLSDVKLRPAAYDVPENAHLKIGLDNNGQVNQMTMVMGELNGQEIGGALDRIAEVNGNARFRGPIFEYIEDKYAKVDGNTYQVGRTQTALQNAIQIQRGLGAGEWVEIGSGVYKYDLGGGTYAQYNNEDNELVDLTVNNGDTLAGWEEALRDALHFDEDGKWVNGPDATRQYVEYGDSAAYRIADDGSIDEDDLAEIATNNSLPALGHWNRVDETMEVVSLGGDAGLQYSDFGHFNPVYSEKKIDLIAKDGDVWTNAGETKTNTTQEMEDEFAGKDYQLFAGGYAINGTSLQDSLDAPRNTTFTGNAIGRVYASIHSNTGGVNKTNELAAWNVTGDGHDMTMDYTTTNAQLIVGANGKETLTMPFANFYNVKVEKTGNANPTFTFTDTANAMAESQYRINNNPASSSIKQKFSPGYYGVGTATEAAGTVYYKSKQDIGIGADAGKVEREWEFQGAYGLKK